MNEDVVNLISDDEDGSSERRLTQLKRADMTNVQGDRHSNEDYSCDVKLEEIRYDHQDSSATTFLGAAFAPKVARDIHKEITDDQQKSSTMLFLRTPPPAKVSLDVQGQEITRQFWKAGDYEIKPPSNKRLLDGMDHVRVHPKFLHSNATSHKWALGDHVDEKKQEQVVN
ncbi:hypothetical protein KP509_1Z126600 [Ceratopteris richardii]|nr:hypothetical protein KP509_1Z126600 [Ceratopteris richardii]